MSADIIPLQPEHAPPAEDVSELVDTLRAIADEVERGDYGKVKHIAVIIDNYDDPYIVQHRTIGHLTKIEWLGMLQLLVHRQASSISC